MVFQACCICVSGTLSCVSGTFSLCFRHVVDGELGSQHQRLSVLFVHRKDRLVNQYCFTLDVQLMCVCVQYSNKPTYVTSHTFASCILWCWYSGTPAMDTPLVWTPRLSGRLPSDSFDFPIGAHSKRASVKWTPRVYGQWTKIAAPMYYRI